MAKTHAPCALRIGLFQLPTRTAVSGLFMYHTPRNLARISRPRRKKRKEKKEGKEGNGRKGDLYVVEVVEEERKEMSGLLGDEFRGGEKWRGSTRLLLLDEVVLKEDTRENTTPTLELLKCRLTLFYDYWQMN
ncbi:hypothetical protein WN944_001760 [Citrus x changshan-huyou]|uniref:Uncharacterized protein n=1 Tax=Citrus x changshan-huyou TaxID=2935761 RepID=A0AAP0QMY9_9ROSI